MKSIDILEENHFENCSLYATVLSEIENLKKSQFLSGINMSFNDCLKEISKINQVNFLKNRDSKTITPMIKTAFATQLISIKNEKNNFSKNFYTISNHGIKNNNKTVGKIMKKSKIINKNCETEANSCVKKWLDSSSNINISDSNNPSFSKSIFMMKLKMLLNDRPEIINNLNHIKMCNLKEEDKIIDSYSFRKNTTKISEYSCNNNNSNNNLIKLKISRTSLSPNKMNKLSTLTQSRKSKMSKIN